MGHMRSHQMTCCKRAAKTQFSGKNTRSHDTGEAARIFPWIRGVSTSNTQEIEHSALRLENCATTNGANFDRWHRHANLEITIEAKRGLARTLL